MFKFIVDTSAILPVKLDVTSSKINFVQTWCVSSSKNPKGFLIV